MKKANTDILKILFTPEQIQNRVKALANEISSDYRNKHLTVVPILKGGAIFSSDLLRNLSIECSVDFVNVASYKGMKSTGFVKLITDLKEEPKGKDILLVEDIADTGYTLHYIQENLIKREAASLKTCVLLDKPGTREKEIKIDYIGFTIPNEFIVGYGLDYNEIYRGLPYIGILKPQIYMEKAKQNDSSHSDNNEINLVGEEYV